MADITPLQTMMQNAAATATDQVKRKLANGNLIPLASCQCDEAGEWSYNFEILSPGRGETVFAAAGHHHGPPPPDGLDLRITRYPPPVKPTENSAVNPGNLLLFHQFAGTADHPLHHLRVTLKPLGDSGESIDLEATAPAGTQSPMTLR